MFSPRELPDVLAAMTWIEKHELLKCWFSNELLEAANSPELRQRDWWVQQSHAKCSSCRAHKYRVEIGGHWRSPFYICLRCGTVESLFDLTRQPSDAL